MNTLQVYPTYFSDIFENIHTDQTLEDLNECICYLKCFHFTTINNLKCVYNDGCRLEMKFIRLSIRGWENKCKVNTCQLTRGLNRNVDACDSVPQ
jgi:hypothetical protein